MFVDCSFSITLHLQDVNPVVKGALFYFMEVFKMYNVNDAVVYSSYGVCVISAIEERDFSGESVEYYVLRPVSDNKNTFYVPTSNEDL